MHSAGSSLKTVITSYSIHYTKLYDSSESHTALLKEGQQVFREDRITSYNVCYTKLLRDVRDIIRSDALLINLRDGRQISSMKLLIAAGGASYPQTGSTGDGFRLAGDLGHTIEPVGPGLVPLETREGFVKALV